MEEEGIEAVLAKAIELRLKISNCIHNAAATATSHNSNSLQHNNNEINGNKTHQENQKQEEDEEEEDEDTERLFYIRDALESLENQLSNLQGLQQQQNYERQAALVEIEQSRKMLLEKLNDYKGGNLEVIQEASAFAADTVADETDLLLPPYPSRLLQSVQFSSTLKSSRNGIPGEVKKILNHVGSNQPQTTSKGSTGGFGRLIGAAAKTLITVVGVVSMLSLTGLGPRFGKKGFSFKISSSTEDDRHTAQCPPGKVLVVEGGETRCVVKERIAIPFDSTVAKPDVNYGSG